MQYIVTYTSPCKKKPPSHHQRTCCNMTTDARHTTPVVLTTNNHKDIQIKNSSQEHWKEKAKRHSRWVEAAKDIAETLAKYPEIDSNFFNSLSTRTIEHMFDAETQIPTCRCTDEGSTMIGITPVETKNGKYQLRIICWLCTRTGKQQLNWDTLGAQEVISIFTSYFYSESDVVQKRFHDSWDNKP